MTSEFSLRKYDMPADRMRQHRQVSQSPILVVEGPDDVLVLRELLQGVEIFPVGGRSIALEAAHQLAVWRTSSFAVVYDTDFEDVGDETTALLGDRLYPYDGIDLEGMLIGLGVLHAVLEVFGSAAKIETHGGVDATVDMMIEAARPISALRALNTKMNLGLTLEDEDIVTKVDKASLVLNYQGYLTMAWSKSNANCERSELPASISDVLLHDVGVRGKDVIAILSVALRRKIGSFHHSTAEPKHLGDLLRSSSGYALSKSPWLLGLQASFA